MEQGPLENKNYIKIENNGEEELASVIEKLEGPDATPSNIDLKSLLMETKRGKTRMQALFQALNIKGFSWLQFIALDHKDEEKILKLLANFLNPNLTKEAITEKAKEIADFLDQT